MEHPSLWTDEAIAILKAGVDQGLPYSDIARRINEQHGTSFSRNAAIGKAMRMGLLAHRPKVIRPQPEKKSRARSNPFVVPNLGRPDDRAEIRRIAKCEPPAPFLGIALLDLKPEHCRYPRGGDEPGDPILFCGQPKMEGSSYCAACHARCCNGFGKANATYFRAA